MKEENGRTCSLVFDENVYPAGTNQHRSPLDKAS